MNILRKTKTQLTLVIILLAFIFYGTITSGVSLGYALFHFTFTAILLLIPFALIKNKI